MTEKEKRHSREQTETAHGGDAGQETLPMQPSDACRETAVRPADGADTWEDTPYRTDSPEASAPPSLTERLRMAWRSLSEPARNAVICAVMAVCLLALLIPATVQAIRAARETPEDASGGFGQAICRALLVTGLPPTDRPLWTLWGGDAQGNGRTETDGESRIGEQTQPTEPATHPTEDTDPSEPTQVIETGTEEPGSATQTDPATEPETDTQTDHEIPTRTEDTTALPDPTDPVDPDTRIMTRDMSESGRGAGYIWNDTDRDPYGLTPGWTPTTAHPVVLIVTSHPFEGYCGGDGTGTVSDLAEALAEDLRARDVSVVLVNSALSGIQPGTSYRETYERTQALAKYYCRLYADIALVLDLRRSAEMTEISGRTDLTGSGTTRSSTTGSITGIVTVGLLRTEGQLDGTPIAQLRLIVDAWREGVPVEESTDLRFALALREKLFAVSPTVSRPVWWRARQGLIAADMSAADTSAVDTSAAHAGVPILLTAELGAAGNTYDEAARLIPLLGQAVAETVGG